MRLARPAARALGIASLLTFACMPARYRQELPPDVRDSTGQAADEGRAGDRASAGVGAADGDAGADATVVGRVTPDGTLIADTLSGPVPDTLRVERETVVTGEVRPGADLGVGPAPSTEARDERLAEGWRVQVYASRSELEAGETAARVRNALGERAPVYVERDDPWFKVRVGDFADRAAAEELRDDLAGLGWPDAWAVRTTIRTLP